MQEIMTGPNGAARRGPAAVLFVIALCAMLAAVVLTVVVVVADGDGPEPCCAGPVAEPGSLPSPTNRAPSTRESDVPVCLVGSWVTVAETWTVKFYNNELPFQFTGQGRYFEFRPDGTYHERAKNFVLIGNFEGDQTRLVYNGAKDATWIANGTTLTYPKLTHNAMTYAAYDSRGLLDKELATHNPADRYTFTCSGTRLEESRPGYHAVLERTSDYGIYG